jgi:hypothetical protein
MAVYRIFPEKDTFISTEVPTGNAGKDEIVEIGGYYDISGTGQANRILVKYSNDDINTAITTIGGASYSASLGMYIADASALPSDIVIYANAVSQSWDNGTGKFGDTPINTSGVSWTYRQAGETSAWRTTGYAAGSTGSYRSQVGGGTWYTSNETTQSYSINSTTYDLSIPVTAAVQSIINATRPNDGFIIRLQPDLEFNTTSSIRLKYFGADTNTIYPPYLEFKWDDSSYVTGSLTVLSNGISTINLTNNRGKYTDVGKQRFRVSARPKYPVRSFTTSSAYLTNYALPSASYWGLKDEYTEEMVVDFDTTFTKVSCDSNGAFFDVYMDGLQPERYYRILIKTTLDGSTTVVDNQNIFKVVRNG